MPDQAAKAAAPCPGPGARLVVESRTILPLLKEPPCLRQLGIPELIVILFIIILIFGANRLPDIGRGIGSGIKNFKDATKEGTRIENGAKMPRPADRS